MTAFKIADREGSVDPYIDEGWMDVTDR